MPTDFRGSPVPYRARIVDVDLQRRLASSGAVVIEGPKACGKTATGEQIAASAVYLDLEPRLRDMADDEPSLILDGKRPRLIDEWQTAPAIWNHVRRAVDVSGGQAGQYILTGSAVPADDITRHTGAGRISRLMMRPMSLFESGHSSGDVSLGDLLAGVPAKAVSSELEVPDLAERLVIGGWPALVSAASSTASRRVRDYVEEICRTDISRVDIKQRDPRRVMRVIQSVARNVATEATTTTVTRDASLQVADENDVDGPTRPTVIDYLSALERLMVIEDQPAWSPHLRSKTRLRKTAKRHFVDPSIAAAALGVGTSGLMRNLNYLGLLFESMVVRDLRIYAQAHDARVSHYREDKGLEVDAIVETVSGAWAAFEVKLGGGERIEEGATNLLRFAERIDPSTTGKPSCLAVIVGSGYGYVRKDGIAVVPIGALGP